MMRRNQSAEAQVNDKLALYLSDLRGGGAERVMLTLAEGFSAYGYSVDLVVNRARGSLLESVAPHVRLVDLGAKRSRHCIPALRCYLEEERPSIILSAQFDENCNAIRARRLARLPARLAVVEHTTMSVSLKARGMRRAHWRARFQYPRADRVVAVSGGVADDLAKTIRFPRDRIDVIYNPVVTPRLLELSYDVPSHPWFAPGQPPVVLGVGKLKKSKDFPNLLHAFARLRRERPARLMILGDRGELQPLRDLATTLGIADDVSLPGFMDNPYGYMRAASLFVLSSQWEGLSMVLIEAMACGTPVVSTDCPSGPAEILENGKWGRMAPVGDSTALADAMLAELDDPHSGVAKRAAYFSGDASVRQYLNVLGLNVPEQMPGHPRKQSVGGIVS